MKKRFMCIMLEERKIQISFVDATGCLTSKISIIQPQLSRLCLYHWASELIDSSVGGASVWEVAHPDSNLGAHMLFWVPAQRVWYSPLLSWRLGNLFSLWLSFFFLQLNLIYVLYMSNLFFLILLSWKIVAYRNADIMNSFMQQNRCFSLMPSCFLSICRLETSARTVW